jgi:SAM-dependent methyltransferase
MTNQPSPWSRRETVEGFATSPPNEVLIRYAEGELARVPDLRVLDLGCGAARNAVPLAQLGCEVIGFDSAEPMLEAARARAEREGVAQRVHLGRAEMSALPLASDAFDLVIAHGIWNLARSGNEFRRAVAEAARVARRGAGLFLFTFSRNTLGPDVEHIAGDPFVFTAFSGEPQCFLTEAEIVAELGASGFVKDPPGPLTEYNRPKTPRMSAGGPVIYEGTFRRR